MSRFNVLLTKELYINLESASTRQDIPKSEFVRKLIEKARKTEYFEKNGLKSVKWSFSGNLSFNLKLSKQHKEWLNMISKNFMCTKGEIVRFLLWKAIQDAQSTEIVLGDIEVSKDPTIIYIEKLLQDKNYFLLNNYLFQLGVSKLLNIGNPSFFIKVIGELKDRYPQIRSELLILRGKLLWYNGQSYDAINELEKIKSSTLNSEIEVKINVIIAEIMTDMGICEQASPLLEDIIQGKVQNCSEWYRVKAFHKFGLCHFYSNNLNDVRSYYEQALKISTTLENKAIAHRYLGSIYQCMELNKESRKHYEISFELFKKLDNQDEYLRLLNTYSRLEIAESNWKSAKEIIKKSLEIAEKIHHIPNHIWALRVYSDITFFMGEVQESLVSIKKALELSEKMQSINHEGKSYHRLAKIYIHLGRYKDAAEVLLKARKLEKRRAGKISTYNTVIKWQNYLRFMNGEDVDFKEMHRQSYLFNTTNQVSAEFKNEYILGYLYLQSKNADHKQRGLNILKRLHSSSMENDSRLIQFAAESTLRFNQFMIL